MLVSLIYHIYTSPNRLNYADGCGIISRGPHGRELTRHSVTIETIRSLVYLSRNVLFLPIMQDFKVSEVCTGRL